MKTMKAIINARKGFNLWLKRKTCCKRDVKFLVLFSLHKSRCVPVINAIVTVYHFTRAHPHTHEVRAGPLFGGRNQNLLIKFELECKPLSASIHTSLFIHLKLEFHLFNEFRIFAFFLWQEIAFSSVVCSEIHWKANHFCVHLSRMICIKYVLVHHKNRRNHAKQSKWTWIWLSMTRLNLHKLTFYAQSPLNEICIIKRRHQLLQWDFSIEIYVINEMKWKQYVIMMPILSSISRPTTTTNVCACQIPHIIQISQI